MRGTVLAAWFDPRNTRDKPECKQAPRVGKLTTAGWGGARCDGLIKLFMLSFALWMLLFALLVPLFTMLEQVAAPHPDPLPALTAGAERVAERGERGTYPR
jgi:hypothetical protein